jgi:hypothetical protein
MNLPYASSSTLEVDRRGLHVNIWKIFYLGEASEMDEKVAKLEQEIRKMMKDAPEWEMRKTSIPGIFVVRLPSKEFNVKLVFNPVDKDGNPRKRKGFYFNDIESVKSARAAFLDDRLESLVKAIESITKVSDKKSTGSDDVLKL